MARQFNADTNKWEDKPAKTKSTPASNTRKRIAAQAAQAAQAAAAPRAKAKSGTSGSTAAPKKVAPTPAKKPMSVAMSQAGFSGSTAAPKKVAPTPAKKPMSVAMSQAGFSGGAASKKVAPTPAKKPASDTKSAPVPLPRSMRPDSTARNPVKVGTLPNGEAPAKGRPAGFTTTKYKGFQYDRKGHKTGGSF